jgi:tripartite-type tricarboxylate transporter receptor subunit TctC
MTRRDVFAVFAVVAVVFATALVGAAEKSVQTVQPTRTLVVYWGQGGTTKKVAEKLAALLQKDKGAPVDVRAIATAEDYSGIWGTVKLSKVRRTGKQTRTRPAT